MSNLVLHDTFTSRHFIPMTACVDLQATAVRQTGRFFPTVMEPSLSCQAMSIIVASFFTLATNYSDSPSSQFSLRLIPNARTVHQIRLHLVPTTYFVIVVSSAILIHIAGLAYELA
jgi:glycyl-tRNA synthetase (class II)